MSSGREGFGKVNEMDLSLAMLDGSIVVIGVMVDLGVLVVVVAAEFAVVETTTMVLATSRTIAGLYT
jgi:Zn-dependent protease